MSATFGCPHCGATYPVKPVLVGRPVRCTTCKQAFRLRPDGIADKVESAAPAAKPEPAPEVVEPAPVAAPRPPTAAHASRPAPPPPPPPQAPAAARSPAARGGLTTAQEQARRSLAANLSSIAEKALRVEEKKQASDRLRKQSDRLARQQAEREGGVGDIGPAVLSGYGQREHRNNLAWTLGCAGTLAVIAAVFLLLRLRSGERAALEAFTEPVATNGYGYRKAAIIERAWLATVPPMVDLEGAHIGHRRTVALAAAKPVLEQLRTLTLLPDKGIWVAPETMPEVGKRWDARKDLAANLAALRKAEAGPVVLEHRDVVRRLEEEGGVPKEDGELLLRFLGTATTVAGADVGKRIRAGSLPDAMQITEFQGARGALLVDFGGQYKRREVDYDGRLLRFVGGGWPGDWRVVDVQTRSREP